MTKQRRVRPGNLGASLWLEGIGQEPSIELPFASFLQKHDVTGVRFNLRLFEEAVATKTGYREEIAPVSASSFDPAKTYSRLMSEAVRRLADELDPTYQETSGRDGFVAVPLPAVVAHDVVSLVDEAASLWEAAERRNVMILVPGTEEGVSALRQLIGDGINAGVANLLNVRRYREALDAYLTGLEWRLARSRDGGSASVASVAEFALGSLDHLQQNLPAPQRRPDGGIPNLNLQHSTALVAYGCYLQSVYGARFERLAKSGARAQRLAWSFLCPHRGTSARQYVPDNILGPATVCELPGEAIKQMEDRSLSGMELSCHLPRAQKVLDFYDNRCSELDELRAQEVDWLISEQVVHTESTIARVEDLMWESSGVNLD